MNEGIRRVARLGAAFAVAAALGGAARGQATQAAAEPTMMFNPSSGQAVMVDPLAAQMLYGTGIPLTRGQAGLSAMSSASRFTGIGSGRVSGVRGGPEPKRGSAAAPRKPTLRAPGGQASGYFNRYGGGTATNVSAPTSTATTRNYYNRPAGFFPEGVR
ncbi:hypothetical protein [Paludisphaera mucosa]|uniref:Uncharacterized protein n=1 Tax=Paludisphaera mucosa TaxID=3030827 RepID=A0ABT6F9N2_9BACT|nr:hypothetical protein [Paludisphaera mucosa]MDG3004108.1 hypothetical protein [Paludisphaera mucosa]